MSERPSFVGGARGATEAVRLALAALAEPDVAAHSARFFQTGLGGYGEGDRFLGIRVPDLRALARAQRALPLEAAFHASEPSRLGPLNDR